MAHKITNVNVTTLTGMCSECGKRVPVRGVKVRRVKGMGVSYRCRTVLRAKGRSPEAIARRKANTKSPHHGLTHAEALRFKAGKVCAICSRVDKLVIDHDHATGKIRGVLCGWCNRGIGSLGDDIGRLESAIVYLRSFQ
jgi:Zn ribbon nucleic-acid-binding protein